MRWKLGAFGLIAFICLGSGCASSPSALQAGKSGIRGTTRSEIVSGVPGGRTVGQPASIEFAVAPIAGDKPSYDKAVFVRSDAQGMFQVELAAGTYWIGPKGKALDPLKFEPGAIVLPETQAVVKAGSFTSVDLVETGYAP